MSANASSQSIFSLVRQWSLTGTLSIALLAGQTAVAESGRADYDLDDDGLIEINDLADLNEIRNHLDGTALYGVSTGCPAAGCTGFELTANLDFDTNGDEVMDDNDTYWNSGAGWTPLGDSSAAFTATFEGNGYTINNLYINTTTTGAGLFGYINSATFQNLSIAGELSSVSGDTSVGALFGAVSGGSITIDTVSVTW